MSQKVRVGLHIFSRLFEGERRFPLVLMLEPLFRCNLKCRGCGKIHYPAETLDRYLTVDECIVAADECGAPIVTIAGGEPLLHPDISRIAGELSSNKKYVYICTNAVLMEKRIHEFEPSRYLTFNIHVDGLEERHDTLAGRKGVFKKAVAAIRELLSKGFQVTTNTTFYGDQDPYSAVQLLNFLESLNVTGMNVAPGFAFSNNPIGGEFLAREGTQSLFRNILNQKTYNKRWNFNHSSLYLDFLAGNRYYPCSPWGNPTRNIFGWQKPCYFLNDGYAASFKELMESTKWDNYGAGKDSRCSNCMLHCGFEASAVMDSVKHPLKAAMVRFRGPGRGTLFPAPAEE